MAQKLSPNGGRIARYIAISQLLITGLFALGFGLWLGFNAAVSASLGGLINTVANLYLAHRVFGGESDPKAIVRNLCIGEFVKMVITVALFVLVLLTLDVAFLPLFITYAATFIAFWIALLRFVD